eukprot:3731721-Pleurochrysis_carterae.AAC.5
MCVRVRVGMWVRVFVFLAMHVCARAWVQARARVDAWGAARPAPARTASLAPALCSLSAKPA